MRWVEEPTEIVVIHQREDSHINLMNIIPTIAMSIMTRCGLSFEEDKLILIMKGTTGVLVKTSEITVFTGTETVEDLTDFFFLDFATNILFCRI